jgi:hypothetical protein
MNLRPADRGSVLHTHRRRAGKRRLALKLQHADPAPGWKPTSSAGPLRALDPDMDVVAAGEIVGTRAKLRPGRSDAPIRITTTSSSQRPSAFEQCRCVAVREVGTLTAPSGVGRCEAEGRQASRPARRAARSSGGSTGAVPRCGCASASSPVSAPVGRPPGDRCARSQRAPARSYRSGRCCSAGSRRLVRCRQAVSGSRPPTR